MAQVQQLLARQRWVTVVGPAGCGKTRLALELAAQDHRAPIVIELQHAASQATPADVAGLLAQALGLGGDGSSNQHELGHALLARAAFANGPEAAADLDEALRLFRTVGDLRCLARCYLRLAYLRPTRERVALLEQALGIARTHHDVTHQTIAMERLIDALWESGAHRMAVMTLLALSSLIGDESALQRCPPGMVADLDTWRPTIAEGQARWPRPISARPNATADAMKAMRNG